MQYTLQRSKLSGCVKAPPSKSQTLRAILFASLAKGQSILKQALNSPDTFAMIRACQQLGAQISDTATIQPTQSWLPPIKITGVSGKLTLPDNVIDAANSGQVLRFIAAVAACLDGHVVLTGDTSIRFNRPLKPLIQGLSRLGARCTTLKKDDYAPVIIQGPIRSGFTRLTGRDSQPISGLLIASTLLPGTTHIEVDAPGETPWIDLTLSWLDRFRIPYKQTDHRRYFIEGGKTINAFDYTVPGDFSTIAYPIAAALVTRSKLIIEDINMQEPQGDKKVIGLLQSMGAQIFVKDNRLSIDGNATLVGRDINVDPFIDALPILAVVACYAEGTTRLINAGIARTKESDRLTAISTELSKMGAQITALADQLIIIRKPLRSAVVYTHQDHRIAMSLAVAALNTPGTTQIQCVACVAKSYPSFAEDLQALGAKLLISQ